MTLVGSVGLPTGMRAFNGLLLIGWSASFTYISIGRFWCHADRLDADTDADTDTDTDADAGAGW